MTENTLPALIPSLSLMKNVPKAAVMLSIASPIEDTPLPVRNLTRGSNTAVIACLPISRIENKPLNVVLSFSLCSLLSPRFSVNSLSRTVILYSCSPVIAGNISRNASLMGLTILIKALQEFQRA